MKSVKHGEGICGKIPSPTNFDRILGQLGHKEKLNLVIDEHGRRYLILAPQELPDDVIQHYSQFSEYSEIPDSFLAYVRLPPGRSVIADSSSRSTDAYVDFPIKNDFVSAISLPRNTVAVPRATVAAGMNQKIYEILLDPYPKKKGSGSLTAIVCMRHVNPKPRKT